MDCSELYNITLTSTLANLFTTLIIMKQETITNCFILAVFTDQQTMHHSQDYDKTNQNFFAKRDQKGIS